MPARSRSAALSPPTSPGRSRSTAPEPSRRRAERDVRRHVRCRIRSPCHEEPNRRRTRLARASRMTEWRERPARRRRPPRAMRCPRNRASRALRVASRRRTCPARRRRTRTRRVRRSSPNARRHSRSSGRMRPRGARIAGCRTRCRGSSCWPAPSPHPAPATTQRRRLHQRGQPRPSRRASNLVRRCVRTTSEPGVRQGAPRNRE